jgi:hypothetical protein
MPGGPRTDRISERDLAVLEFISRYGAVPRRAVAVWSGCGRTATFERSRRLRAAGLVEVRASFGDGERVLLATPLGLRLCDRRDLRPARLSPATVRHEALTAELGALLERRGEALLSEREILARERAEGAPLFSAKLAGGRLHRADLVRLAPDGGPGEAIELELTVKGAARLDALLRAWRLAVAERRLSGVVYHCSPYSRRFVEAAIARTRTEAMISAVPLEPGGGTILAPGTSKR